MAKKRVSKKQAATQKQSIPTVSGQGGYYSDKIAPALAKVFPKGTFSTAGGLAGSVLAPLVSANPYASAFGKTAGSALGHSISQLAGFGDYSVLNNTLANVGKAISPGSSVPSFGVMGEATVIRHREYIGDIIATGNTTFSVTSFPINPALTSTFPWLATMANNFQQYIFNGLVFEFVSTASEYVTNIGMGSIILATDYDSVDTPFLDKRHMENSQYCVSAKPSMCQIHTIECLPSAVANKLYYTRGVTPPSNTDIRNYDLGLFQVALTGITAAAGTVLGELWASYDLALYKPIISNISSLGQKIVPTSGLAPAAPFGTAQNYTGSTYFLAVSGNTLVCQVSGSYLLTMSISGSGPSIPIWGGTGSIGNTVYVTSTLGASTVVMTAVGFTSTVGQIITLDTTLWTALTSTQMRWVPYDRSVA